jgi:hypothetical protein
VPDRGSHRSSFAWKEDRHAFELAAEYFLAKP